MSKKIQWLLAEVELWQTEGLITPDQASKLRRRYPLPADGPPWGLLVFACAGVIVLGLGVILLFAYNWDEIPKFGKLALIFGATLGAHAGGLHLYRRDGWHRRLGEALMLLGTMFFGAGIWLVAQVYHIDEHYPNGFLLWAAGALALAWVLPSTIHGLVATVLIAIWGGSETMEFHDPKVSALLLLAVGIVPLAWRQASALLLAFALSATGFLLLSQAMHFGGVAHTMVATLALGVLLIAAGHLTRHHRPEFSAGATVMSGFGFVGFLVCAYTLGFPRASADLLNLTRTRGEHPTLALMQTWSLFGCALAAWLWSGRLALQRALRIPPEEWLVPIALLYAYGCAALGPTGPGNDGVAAVAFNFVVLGIAVMWMWRGCNTSQLRTTVLGSLLLAVLALARYFDLFHSLAARGFAFILLGGVFLAEAMYYRRNRRNASESSGGDS